MALTWGFPVYRLQTPLHNFAYYMRYLHADDCAITCGLYGAASIRSLACRARAAWTDMVISPLLMHASPRST